MSEAVVVEGLDGLEVLGDGGRDGLGRDGGWMWGNPVVKTTGHKDGGKRRGGRRREARRKNDRT